MSPIQIRTLVAAATVALAPLAQAELVFTDNFSVGPGSVSQLTVGSSSIAAANAPVAGINRTLTVDVIAQGADAANMGVTAGLFTLAAANTGTFGVANYGLGYSGAGFAGYGPGSLGTISFDLLSLDQVPLNVDLLISTFTGTVLATLNINSMVVPSSYSISGVADFSQGFTLRFSGQPAYDFSIDNLQFTIPEPGSFALAGLALLGLAAARRRRA